jgi:hypothetical protein
LARDQLIARLLPVHKTAHKHRINTHTQTSMPQVGFEPMIPVFEWAKAVNALDHMATVVGIICYTKKKRVVIFIMTDSKQLLLLFIIFWCKTTKPDYLYFHFF